MRSRAAHSMHQSRRLADESHAIRGRVRTVVRFHGAVAIRVNSRSGTSEILLEPVREITPQHVLKFDDVLPVHLDKLPPQLLREGWLCQVQSAQALTDEVR